MVGRATEVEAAAMPLEQFVTTRRTYSSFVEAVKAGVAVGVDLVTLLSSSLSLFLL